MSPIQTGLCSSEEVGNCNRYRSMSVILELCKSAMLIVFTDCAGFTFCEMLCEKKKK